MWKFKFLKQEEQAPAGGVAPAAPVAAPVTPAPVTPEPVAAPVEAPVAEAPKPLNYANPAAKQVGNMLKEAGLEPTKVRDALAANNGVCTPEIYQAIVAKHGEGMAGLLVSQMGQLHAANVTASQAADKAIFDQCAAAFQGVTEQSGEQTFNELKSWAQENIADADRDELNKCIKQGGMAAKLAIQELVNAFQQSGDYSQDMVGVTGDNTTGTPPAGGDLTRSEYTAELDKLIKKGHSYDHSPEVKALQARRARSAARGL